MANDGLVPTTIISTEDIEAVTVGKGFVLASPDGTRWRIKVSDEGILSVEAI